MNDDENENDVNNNNNNMINNGKTITIKSVEYKPKIIGRTPNDSNTLDAEVVFPLKYLSNFLIYLD